MRSTVEKLIGKKDDFISDVTGRTREDVKRMD